MRGSMARSLVAAILPAALLIAAGGSLEAAPPREVKRFWRHTVKATRHMEAGRYRKAVKVWSRATPAAPENPGPWYGLASSLARLGDVDGAFDALDRSVALGYAGASHAEGDDDLAPLREDPRFADLLERMRANEDRWLERVRTVHREVPASEVAAYDSLEALVAAYDAREAELERTSPLLGWHRSYLRTCALHDEKLGALERYLAEHPDAADREATMLETFRTALAYKEGWPFWAGDAQLVADKARRFLETFPESDSRSSVELHRAVATWKDHDEDDREATLARRAADAGRLFTALETAHPDSEEAARSKVWRLAIAGDLADGLLTPEQSALHDELKPLIDEDDVLADYAWEHAPRPLFRIEGERSFDGVDLAGRRWTWESMRGRVVLIDFWATWCGPCLSELPYLKQAYAEFRDRGFEIVGVSLDGDDREAFERECEKNGVDWPQIYDGKGWEAELARRFRIRGVPTPVLLDREGNVAAIHGDARNEKLLEKVAELVEAPRASAR